MVVGPPFESPVSLGRCALVADDDASMGDVLRTVLTGAGYTVLLAATGREALSLAANLDAVVAIIDLAMPDGDGLETCLGLRKIPRWRNVPILVLSHYHTEKALRAALRAGANGFVCKPYQQSFCSTSQATWRSRPPRTPDRPNLRCPIHGGNRSQLPPARRRRPGNMLHLTSSGPYRMCTEGWMTNPVVVARINLSSGTTDGAESWWACAMRKRGRSSIRRLMTQHT
jgi:two-component system, chemotaxis family, chemotaxis protein CheY